MFKALPRHFGVERADGARRGGPSARVGKTGRARIRALRGCAAVAHGAPPRRSRGPDLTRSRSATLGHSSFDTALKLFHRSSQMIPARFR